MALPAIQNEAWVQMVASQVGLEEFAGPEVLPGLLRKLTIFACLGRCVCVCVEHFVQPGGTTPPKTYGALGDAREVRRSGSAWLDRVPNAPGPDLHWLQRGAGSARSGRGGETGEQRGRSGAGGVPKAGEQQAGPGVLPFRAAEEAPFGFSGELPEQPDSGRRLRAGRKEQSRPRLPERPPRAPFPLPPFGGARVGPVWRGQGRLAPGARASLPGWRLARAQEDKRRLQRRQLGRPLPLLGDLWGPRWAALAPARCCRPAPSAAWP
ncbi:uncharacterized protein LOC132712457 [Pantherophis guttatus]|uniref:Uncharacterized protein LOC132712457 n=1 Tax=Pantherophis guttatus TaxID=94885 RepID=A0ABM3ZNP8_PANGU|nr:uncharacterized protein LOC132712457 [Pantherophis guttatus]